jgi:hypothetical protein
VRLAAHHAIDKKALSQASTAAPPYRCRSSRRPITRPCRRLHVCV